MSADVVPLFSRQMDAKLIPFPMARRIGKIRHVAKNSLIIKRHGRPSTQQQVTVSLSASLRRARSKHMEDSRPFSPCIDQSEKDIEAYYRHAEIGQAAVVRHTQGHMLQYVISEIEGGNRGRVYVHNAGAFYMKNGKNCFHPKGQTTLVVPTDEVLAWAKEHPQGEFGYSVFRSTRPFGR